MPPTSRAQQKAMYAAAEGKSKLGIPQSVGKEFTQAPQPKGLPAKAPSAPKPARPVIKRRKSANAQGEHRD